MREGLHKIISDDETIVAVSTPLGRSGVGMVRISGHRAIVIAQQFFKSSSAFEHRRALVGIWVSEAGDVIDEVIVTCFRGPQSYTGEDVVEVSGHGNPFVLRRIVECVRCAGARIAAPGEFTLRAAANGKMDLIQAEAVREFIDAQTEEQARTAFRQMEGGLSKRIRPLKEALVDVIARLEAGIDFAEDDIEVPHGPVLTEQLGPVLAQLEALQQTFGYGRMLTEGLRLAILGKPNVGKSSLFNRFISADRAIVTDIPGTTRDVITETISLDGVPLRIADTAGLRETVDEVEIIGVNRTLETLSDADLTLVIIDGSNELEEADRRVLGKAEALPHFIIINKSDLPDGLGPVSLNETRVVRVSAKTGAGLEELRDAIREFVLERKTDMSDDLVLTNERQNEAVLRAISALRTGIRALADQVPHEMVLLDYYEALSALDELTGEVVNDDILGRIFSAFCVGK